MEKRIVLLILSLAVAALLYAGPVPYDNTVSYTQEAPDLERMYMAAIIDSMTAQEDEIYKELIPITESNADLQWKEDSGEKYVLVVTWTKYPESYPVGSKITTYWGDTWTMVIPELRDFVQQSNVSDNDLTIRLEQLIGLPSNNGNEYFVELWVRPNDLFRPSPDPEITDTQAQLDFPDNVSEEHMEWFNSLNASIYTKYPWTRLGYTYDWGETDDDVGVSEYVIRKNSEVIVQSVSATEDYFD